MYCDISLQFMPIIATGSDSVRYSCMFHVLFSLRNKYDSATPIHLLNRDGVHDDGVNALDGHLVLDVRVEEARKVTMEALVSAWGDFSQLPYSHYRTSR